MDMMLIKVFSQSQGLAANLRRGMGVAGARREEPCLSPEEEAVVAEGNSREGQPLTAKNSRLQCLMSTFMPVCLGTVVIFMRRMQKG